MLNLNNCRFEPLTDGDRFLGLGKIWIGERLVRSGRLPLTPHTITFTGQELSGLTLLGTETSEEEIRFRLLAAFEPTEMKIMRDHSFDPIHETGDWDPDSRQVLTGELDLVIRPASDEFGGINANGFSYHYEYRGEDVPLFYLMDKASWELDGDILQATAVSQSSCSDPIAEFDEDLAWSTEGMIHFLPDLANPVMTHNLPRWASHQSFDFQWKNGEVLLGVFEQVSLIRSLLKREPGAAELKVFDKHIFDQDSAIATTPKKILLVNGITEPVDMKNFWTWVFDEIHERARAEFGLKKEPTIPRCGHNYWRNFTIDTYYKDVLPAGIAIGVKQFFVDNLNKSDMTEGGVSSNMCNGQRYEPAEKLGGKKKLKQFVEDCKKHDIQVVSWTNNDQSYGSPFLFQDNWQKYDWWVKMEDTRLRYGGAYSNTFAIWDFNNDEARRYWVDSLIKNREETGLNGYLFDSFYNLGFMPVSYRDGKPRTMWRKLLEAFKELQDHDVHFNIESFGPFGQSLHGCPSSYNIDRCWVCYEIGLGNDSTTVPTGLKSKLDARSDDAAFLHYILAHKTVPPMPLYKDDKRIDEIWLQPHRRALADYHAVLDLMHRRFLQPDDRALIWHNEAEDTAVIWAFQDFEAKVDGVLTCVSTGEQMSTGAACTFLAQHTYTLQADKLPSQL